MDESLETKIGLLLRERGLRIATAESCTGGLIAHRITDVAGSSDYFLGGVVAYANEAKVGQLGVLWDTLRAHGAVSRETALEIARGARAAFGAEIAVSVTRIAGPGGGLPGKPVGTTWVGLSTPEGDWARHFVWAGDRQANKQLSAEAALTFVLDYFRGQAG